MNNKPGGYSTGAALLYLFASPFCVVGIVTLLVGLREALKPNPEWQTVGHWIIFGSTFSIAGFSIVAATFHGVKKARHEAKLKAINPNSPWTWREDWASGMIPCSGKATLIVSWIFTAIWNLISTPLLFKLPEEVFDKQNYPALLGFLFPLVGVGLVVWAVRVTARWKKYGTSIFEMAFVPAAIGGKLAGIIHTTRNITPDDGFRLKLTCVRRIVTNSGKNSSTREKILWEEQQTMSRELLERDTARSAVPVSFPIPADCASTDSSNPKNQVLWRLEARAEVSGFDYHALFEVPVFQVSETATVAADAANDADDVAAIYRKEEAPLDVVNALKVAVQPLSNGGKEFFFPAARNRGAATSLALFTLLWIGTIFPQVLFGAPAIFPILTGVFGFLLLWATLELCLGTARATFDGSRVVLQRGFFGGGRTREIPYSDVAELKLGIGMQSNSKPYYDIELFTHASSTRADGRPWRKKHYVGRHVADKRHATWLLEEMRSCLAREESPVGSR